MTRMFRLLVPLLLVALIPTMTLGQQQSGLPMDESIPLTSTVFASGLNFPAGMALLPDGDLLVGSSNPTGGSYFRSTGQLLRLSDGDGDGVADGEPLVVADDLAGAITAVAIGNDVVIVTSTEPSRERIQFLRGGGDWNGPYDPLGEITFRFRGFMHTSYGLATRLSPIDPTVTELYFNIGAHGNDTAGVTVKTGGLLSAELPDASLYMVEIHDDGAAISLSDPVQIASGLRNAMGFGFHPDSGTLWISDNGIDGLQDVWTALSADELNLIEPDAIGGEAEHFGFPETFTDYATGEVVGTTGIQPVVAFVPTNGMENEGVASLAILPAGFSPTFGNYAIAGFHGQYDLTGSANEENALLAVDLASGAVVVLVPSGSEGIGHLDSAVVGADELFVADLCVDGTLGGADPCGVIYRIAP